MPSIHKLQLSSFRNISQASLSPAARVNLVAGENGSGKSSLLEAIYLLGMGRSFRNTQQTPLIQQGQRTCSVFVQLNTDYALGISRSLDDAPQIKIQGEKAQSTAELAKHLPLQLLNAEAFHLLEGGPKSRRQYLDWGVFHVEHAFFNHWRSFRRSLQNRNSLLKKHAPLSELVPWTREMVRHAMEIDKFRKEYLESFLPFLRNMLSSLITLEDLSFRYYRGWAEEESLEDVILRNQDRDFSLGYTTAGPQRADLKIRMASQNACDILSRGQQKLVVSAMKLAQGAFLSSHSGQECLYLIDDLPAELDRVNRRKVCMLLNDLSGQIFITGTDSDELAQALEESGLDSQEYKLFHVEHGKISELER